MRTEDFIELGFNANKVAKSSYTGELSIFHKKIDNGHVIIGHDTTDVYLRYDKPFLVIEVGRNSSYQYGDKKIVFSGKCEDVEFFKMIIKAVI